MSLRKMRNKTDKAITYARRLINIRSRSERELKDRLFRKGFDRTTIQDVISLLKEKDVIDDFKFAKIWIESRMHTRPEGDMLLRKELREKGVSGSIIEKALSEKKGKEDSIAREVAGKRIETLKKLPKEKAKKKLFDLLVRRGFKFDIIEEIVKEVIGAESNDW